MAIQIFATGVSITTGVASAGATIPLDSAGRVPRYIRISVTANAHVRIGGGVQTAVATDLLVCVSDSIIISVNGSTHIAALQQMVAGVVQVSPVEDI